MPNNKNNNTKEKDTKNSKSKSKMSGTPLIKVENLKQFFPVKDGAFKTKQLKAVNDVSFEIYPGETLGLVGESGCGKTTTGRSVLNLYKPTSGHIYYKGNEIKTKQDIEEFRKHATMVFQDPYSSLNPRMTVADIIAEPIVVQKLIKDKNELNKRVLELMSYVGLNSEHATRYAHEFSGGQRQRIGIARALAINPDFIVCDEPVSALDVSIQAQVINIFKELQKNLGLTYLFIAHDLLIVKHVSDRIAVMYLGHMLELGNADDIYYTPRHPYSKTLLSAVPVPDPVEARSNKRIVLTGDVPSPLNAPSGCPFRTWCQYETDVCSKSMPELRDVANGHYVACHNLKKVDNDDK